MTGWLRFLTGRTPRQRRLRLGEMIVFLGLLALIALGLGGRVEERPGLAVLYLSAFVFFLIIWMGLVMLDLREGLKHVLDRESKETEKIAK